MCKHFNHFCRAVFVSVLYISVLSTVSGCDFALDRHDGDGEGSLVVNFPREMELPKIPLVTVQGETTAGYTEAELRQEVQIDTNDFILSVTNSSGASLYYGTFGAAPKKIITSSGSYTISAKSCDFFSPLFGTPQYGDTQVAVVKPGAECRVLLNCAQVNAGIVLQISPVFLTEYPDGVLFLKSSEGKLMYGYSEKRIAYFRPGNVSVVLNVAGKETTLATYKLEAKQILRLKLDVQTGSGAQPIKSGISIKVDTSRVWRNDQLTIGQGGGTSPGAGKGDAKENALSVSAAKDNIGDTDVWVYGYVVGGDLSSSRCSFEAPFNSKTNIVLAEKSSCRDKEDCLSVQLSAGAVRDALNLVDNPGLLGKKIFLKGDIVEAYYGIPGVQSVSEYSL